MNNLIKLLDKNLEYIEHEIIDDSIYISVKSIKEYICCPYCCTPSNKVHSKYKRSFQDLPIQGLKVIIIGLMSIFWTQKVKLFYAALLANNSH